MERRSEEQMGASSRGAVRPSGQDQPLHPSATHLISASSRGAVRHPGQGHSFTTSSPSLSSLFFSSPHRFRSQHLGTESLKFCVHKRVNFPNFLKLPKESSSHHYTASSKLKKESSSDNEAEKVTVGKAMLLWHTHEARPASVHKRYFSSSHISPGFGQKQGNKQNINF